MEESNFSLNSTQMQVKYRGIIAESASNHYMQEVLSDSAGTINMQLSQVNLPRRLHSVPWIMEKLSRVFFPMARLNTVLIARQP